jgi:putative ABC transport system permease protein
LSLVELKNVGKWVKDGKRKRWLFRHVNLTLPSNGFFAICGPSGCGKSTFLSLLSGLGKPSEGRIKIANTNLAHLKKKDEAWYRQKVVSLVFQHYNLIDGMSSLSNAALPGYFAGEEKKSLAKGKALLKEVGLLDKAKQNASLCSGGEKQRIAICRALINDPLILLCDEPTGALDEKSSKTVMALLKKISSERLVIIVSHNQKLLDEYADAQWSFGSPCPRIESGKSVKPLQRSRGKGNSSWKKFFLKRHLKKHFRKNLICGLTSSLGLLSGLLSFGYFRGNEKAVAKQTALALDYRTLELTCERKIEVESSPLNLIETTRPSVEECLDLLDGIKAEIHPDFSYFFPKASPFVFNGFNMDSVSFAPLLSFEEQDTAERLGYINDELGMAVVNEAFEASYPEIGVGQKIYVPYSFDLTNDDGKKETICGDFEFEIVCVAADFPFMSSPKVYYSQKALEWYFRGIMVDDNTSVYEYVEGAKDNSVYSSYARLAFCKTTSDADALYSLCEQNKEGVKASSSVRSCIASFTLLSNGTSWALLAFTLISLLSLAVVMMMSNYSSFLEERKERAVLSSLGAYWSDVDSVSYAESLLCGLLSGLLAICLSPFLSYLGNALFKSKFGLDGLIDIPLFRCWGVPLSLPLLVLGASCLFNLLCCLLPLRKANTSPLWEELHDE